MCVRHALTRAPAPWSIREMHVLRALVLTLALVGRAEAEQHPVLAPALGFASLTQRTPSGQRSEASGVALELRVDGRTAPRFGYDVTFTWGLTDWDRARESIDAGNRAGSWTTDKFADVEAWARRAGEKDQGLRVLGAIFADAFLALTYVAVPVCYIGSVGGATSHLQLDITGSFHLAEGSNDAWIELGAGAAALPQHLVEWRRAVGPRAQLEPARERAHQRADRGPVVGTYPAPSEHAGCWQEA